MTPEHTQALKALSAALTTATECGALEWVWLGYCRNPDSINDVCDAVEAALAQPEDNEATRRTGTAANDRLAVHNFQSSGQAYDATQSDPAVKKGDVLVIESEGVVGVAHTWPFAVTEKCGELHQLGADNDEIRNELGKSILAAQVVAKGLGRKYVQTPASGVGVGDLIDFLEVIRIDVREKGTKMTFHTKDIRTGEEAATPVASSDDPFVVRRLIEQAAPEA